MVYQIIDRTRSHFSCTHRSVSVVCPLGNIQPKPPNSCGAPLIEHQPVIKQVWKIQFYDLPQCWSCLHTTHSYKLGSQQRVHSSMWILTCTSTLTRVIILIHVVQFCELQTTNLIEELSFPLAWRSICNLDGNFLSIRKFSIINRSKSSFTNFCVEVPGHGCDFCKCV